MSRTRPWHTPPQRYARLSWECHRLIGRMIGCRRRPPPVAMFERLCAREDALHEELEALRAELADPTTFNARLWGMAEVAE